jgi:MFS family permease
MALSAKFADQNFKNLIAAIAAVSVFCFSLGEMYPLLSLKLEAMGTSPDMIGLNSAMSPIGIMVAGMFVSRLAHYFGPKPVALWAAGLTGLVLLAYPLFPTLAMWFVLRFIQGALVAVLFALSESWVVAFSRGRYQARVTAIYSSVIAAGFGAGAGVLGFTGIDGPLPFIIGAVVMWLAMPVIAMVKASAPNPEDSHVGVVSFFPKAPLLLLAVLVHALLDGASIGFFPVYALAFNYTAETAAFMVTALAFGNVLLQLPIGWLADHFSKRLVIIWCFAVTGVGLIILENTMQTFWVWPLLMIVGASSFGIYTVALASLGERFKGPDLVAGTAAFSAMWGAGALLGSVLVGYAIEAQGPQGLPNSLIACIAIYLVLQAFRLFQMRRARRS